MGYCKECFQGEMLHCTACAEGYRLRIVDPLTKSGECMLQCPKGFFRDAPDDQRCIQCAAHCAECDSPHNCFKCNADSTLFNGICYQTPKAAVQEAITMAMYM